MSLSERASSVAAYAAGAITTAIGALTWQEWAAAVGIVCTVATLAVNAWHKRRMVELRRQELEIAKRRMDDDVD